MIVEPYAGDRVEENLNPVGRAYYAASTLICTPCSLAQEVGLALGAQAGEARMREVVPGAGFTRSGARCRRRSISSTRRGLSRRDGGAGANPPSPRGAERHGRGRIAIARTGAPLPPSIFIGSAMT